LAPDGADGYFHVGIIEAVGQAGKSGQLAAFIQQRIRHGYRRQRPTPLPSCTAKIRHQSQLGVDTVEVAHSPVSVAARSAKCNSPTRGGFHQIADQA
jgi:hypothetical protein